MTQTTTTTTTTPAASPTIATPGTSTARGCVVRVVKDAVVFVPDGTPYELHLHCPSFDGPIGTPVRGVIRATARKAYTVPSGGNFVTPIYGPPKIIQGRVRSVDPAGGAVVLQAGTLFHVRLPIEASAVELANGPIAAGSLLNVVALPGAAFEWVK